jgi:GntR family transcriptional regulator
MVRKSVSLAQQVVNELLAGIQAGSLARDDGLLPSEADLSQRYNVSRATIREALSKLEQAGLIIRRHGVGTFVAPPSPVIDAGLEELESLETLAQRIGLETHMGKCVVEERTATPREANRLQMSSGEPVLSVARVILAGKRPVAYLIDIVPAQYLHKSDLADAFNGSVPDVFIRRGAPDLSHSRTDIVPESADETTARQLRVKPGDTLLRLEARLYARDGSIVDYSISYFVPGFFRFHVVRRVGNNELPLKSQRLAIQESN